MTLLIAFSAGDGGRDTRVGVSTDGVSVRVTLDGEPITLSRQQARRLRDDVAAALTAEQAYLHTAGRYREDGTYVVARRNADSAGNQTVFDSFAALRRLYDRLPDEITAETVGRAGVTGSRRHMIVRHFAEHPAFAATLASHNPLTVHKAEDGTETDGERNRTSAD
jgi:hypothetical protein